LGIDKSNISFNAYSLIFKGEFSVGELGSVILGEPFDEGLERIEVVVVNAKLLFGHIGGKNYIVI
jgi:hypothetical protein